jgi:hypothetical protein
MRYGVPRSTVRRRISELGTPLLQRTTKKNFAYFERSVPGFSGRSARYGGRPNPPGSSVVEFWHSTG